MRRTAVLLAAMWLMKAGGAFAQSTVASEAAVKAAFLFKFAGYVECQESLPQDAPIVFTIVGSDEVASELERISAGRTINGHPVVVKRMQDTQSLAAVKMLFLAQRGALSPGTLRVVREHKMLAVTEQGGGLEAGSAINFVPIADRIGFEVSLDAAERAGCRISSRMLAVAQRVIPKS